VIKSNSVICPILDGHQWMIKATNNKNLKNWNCFTAICMRKCTLWSDNTCVFTRFHSVKNANTHLIWSSAINIQKCISNSSKFYSPKMQKQPSNHENVKIHNQFEQFQFLRFLLFVALIIHWCPSSIGHITELLFIT
jgi:hypothetical protein